MDYKELIERLNDYSAKHQRHGGITAEAADAIETLLAERDAAIEDILMVGRSGMPCFACGKRLKCNPFYCEGWREWQWRGPQK